MNFQSLYNYFHKQKLTCQFHETHRIDRIFVGSGGSSSVVLSVSGPNSVPVIVKVIPKELFIVTPHWYHPKLEIKFYQFLTKKFILTNRTPHIVGIYNHQTCNDLHKFLTRISPQKLKCPSYEDQLQRKITQANYEIALCDLLLKTQMKLFDPKFDIMFLEFCDETLDRALQWHMHQILVAKKKFWEMTLKDFTSDLNRILFQLIFTLGVIQLDYPGFLHGDLFIRNVLINTDAHYKESDWIAYHYDSKTFYLPANGSYAKINDFGDSILGQITGSYSTPLDKSWNAFYHKNPFNNKTDIFNLLHDIYDGQETGSHSLMGLARILKLPKFKIRPVRNLLKKYININIIDRINKNNRMLLDDTWHIDKLPLLEQTVKTPHDYLKSNLFDQFTKLPAGATVIKEFNA